VNLSVICGEQLPAAGGAAIEMAAAAVPPPLALGLAGRFYARACPLWGVPPVAAGVHAPVTTALPVLLLGGQLDPLAPPSGARQVAMTMANAQVVDVPSAGHAVLHGPCSGATAVAFLADPRAAVMPPACSAGNPD
jgi:pimeloyl-ACP methyl ester carboxylesterase